MKSKYFSLSDIPRSQSTNDFGTEGYVRDLIRFISHAATPITIALQGEWGSGKTSLINRLYNELCADKAGFITGENICIDGGMTRLMIYHNDNNWKFEENL